MAQAIAMRYGYGAGTIRGMYSYGAQTITMR